MKTPKLTFVLSCIALTISCSSPKGTFENPPNILFIMSDDHTSQAWGIYGGILKDYVQNQNIKRLAAQGAVLNNVFCTNSICVPSRASIMTGLYSHENQVYTLNDSLKYNQHSISQTLQSEGYETAIVGKWHLKEKPAGFDYIKVLPGQGRYHNPIFRKSDNWDQRDKWGEISGFSADAIAEESIHWLGERDKNKPFFLMTHFKATHEPFDYPKRFSNLYKGDSIPEPSTLWDKESREFQGQQLSILGQRYESNSSDSTRWGRYPGLPINFKKEESEDRRSEIYQKFIKDFMRSGAAIDDNIGNLLDYLEANDLVDNTIVIYTSDQGYFLGEHGFFDKRIMYEEALRMPFVIRYPLEIAAGTKVDDIILNVDFPALFQDYAKNEDLTFGSGHSFRSILQGKQKDDWRTEMYYRYWQHLDIRPGHLGIRSDRYKLIFFYGDPLGKKGTMPEKTAPFWEFYDLKADPFENYNLIQEEKYRSQIEEMRLELIRIKKEVGDEETVIPEIF